VITWRGNQTAGKVDERDERREKKKLGYKRESQNSRKRSQEAQREERQKNVEQHGRKENDLVISRNKKAKKLTKGNEASL